MPFVSVIVPAFNTEVTIEKIIRDILAQSYEDFELIIVDDGSTDTTPQLCDEAAERDLRIHVLHQKNSGQARARNNGVNIACGDYITFIDSDDRVEPYYLEYLVKAIQQDQVDIACGGVDRVREGYELNPSVACFRLEYFDRKTALQEMLTDKKIGVGPCCRLVRREWQLENPFIDNTLYEDLSNTYKTYLLAERVAFVDAYLYHYVMRGGSILKQLCLFPLQLYFCCAATLFAGCSVDTGLYTGSKKCLHPLHHGGLQGHRSQGICHAAAQGHLPRHGVLGRPERQLFA